MNIIFYTLIFLGIVYFLLKLVANTSSKKISKHLRKLIFLGLIILAILLVVAGKFLLSIPLTLLSLALVKLKGFSIFQLIGLFRLIQTLRNSGRFSFNQNKTNLLRQALLDKSSTDESFFDYGKSRTEFELVWTRENYDLLTQILAAAPVHWRFFIKHRLFSGIGNEVKTSNTEKINILFDEMLEEFPQLKESMNFN